MSYHPLTTPFYMKIFLFLFLFFILGCSKDSALLLPKGKSFRPVRYELTQSGSAYVLKSGTFQTTSMPEQFNDPENYQDSGLYQVELVDEAVLYAVEFVDDQRAKVTFDVGGSFIELNLDYKIEDKKIILDGGQQLYPVGSKIIFEYDESKDELTLPLLETFFISSPFLVSTTFLSDWNKYNTQEEQLIQVKNEINVNVAELDTVILFHQKVIYK
jgi:hypothetical protein